MFKTLELPGGFAPLPGLCPGPTGGLSGPQTPRPIILHPPFLIPGYGPAICTEKRHIKHNMNNTLENSI